MFRKELQRLKIYNIITIGPFFIDLRNWYQIWDSEKNDWFDFLYEDCELEEFFQNNSKTIFKKISKFRTILNWSRVYKKYEKIIHISIIIYVFVLLKHFNIF